MPPSYEKQFDRFDTHATHIFQPGRAVTDLDDFLTQVCCSYSYPLPWTMAQCHPPCAGFMPCSFSTAQPLLSRSIRSLTSFACALWLPTQKKPSMTKDFNGAHVSPRLLFTESLSTALCSINELAITDCYLANMASLLIGTISGSSSAVATRAIPSRSLKFWTISWLAVRRSVRPCPPPPITSRALSHPHYRLRSSASGWFPGQSQNSKSALRSSSKTRLSRSSRIPSAVSRARGSRKQ